MIEKLDGVDTLVLVDSSFFFTISRVGILHNYISYPTHNIK
jgi:hypothetical protein